MSFSTISFLTFYSQTRSSVATRQVFGISFDKFLISLMAFGLNRANQIFREIVKTSWKTLHVCQISTWSWKWAGFCESAHEERIADKYILFRSKFWSNLTFLHSKRFFQNSVVVTLILRLIRLWNETVYKTNQKLVKGCQKLSRVATLERVWL